MPNQSWKINLSMNSSRDACDLGQKVLCLFFRLRSRSEDLVSIFRWATLRWHEIKVNKRGSVVKGNVPLGSNTILSPKLIYIVAGYFSSKFHNTWSLTLNNHHFVTITWWNLKNWSIKDFPKYTQLFRVYQMFELLAIT